MEKLLCTQLSDNREDPQGPKPLGVLFRNVSQVITSSTRNLTYSVSLKIN